MRAHSPPGMTRNPWVCVLPRKNCCYGAIPEALNMDAFLPVHQVCPWLKAFVCDKRLSSWRSGGSFSSCNLADPGDAICRSGHVCHEHSRIRPRCAQSYGGSTPLGLISKRGQLDDDGLEHGRSMSGENLGREMRMHLAWHVTPLIMQKPQQLGQLMLTSPHSRFVSRKSVLVYTIHVCLAYHVMGYGRASIHIKARDMFIMYLHVARKASKPSIAP
ncbi:hypothetical protein M8818_004872 [Zalaria obscura]|uniref:Uncharacterized protein n=1 Tax=Zalaria obscura TaxID=2024903 RepID=A0ACC3SB87_9PEZI